MSPRRDALQTAEAGDVRRQVTAAHKRARIAIRELAREDPSRMNRDASSAERKAYRSSRGSS